MGEDNPPDMKKPVSMLALLVLMGTSCSTYRKVSQDNLDKQDLTLNDLVSLDYRLKETRC